MTSLRPTYWTKTLVYTAYGYVVLALTIFHCSLGDLGISIFLSIYEALMPLEFVIIFGLWAAIFISSLGWIVVLVESILRRSMARILETLKGLAAVILVASIPGVLSFFALSRNDRVVPDLAISVSERDQLATLIVGVVTLAFTLWDLWHRWKPEAEDEEMQMLRNNN